MDNTELQIQLANTYHQREVQDLQAAGLNPILSAYSSSTVPNIMNGSGSIDSSSGSKKSVSGRQALRMASMNPVNKSLDVANHALNTVNTAISGPFNWMFGANGTSARIGSNYNSSSSNKNPSNYSLNYVNPVQRAIQSMRINSVNNGLNGTANYFNGVNNRMNTVNALANLVGSAVRAYGGNIRVGKNTSLSSRGVMNSVDAIATWLSNNTMRHR